MPNQGDKILALGLRHAGERYVLGAFVPKNNANWRGPWDCAEFASWLVFQIGAKLYGCERNSADPAGADAYSGYWARDARSLGERIPLDRAARTPGAVLVRAPQANAIGHVVISDGAGGTVEAHSSRRGVITSTLSGRRWDHGVLVPGLTYAENGGGTVVRPPRVVIFRLTNPHMKDPVIKEIQRALRTAGFDPGPIDGDFGLMTQAAVISFQATRGLVPDGEVGRQTARSLGVTLPEN